MRMLVLLLVLSYCPTAFHTYAGGKPRLVVAIIIDQFRFDYLERYYQFYSPSSDTSGGFRRLLDNGAWLRNAHCNYSGTYTAPGHATFLSGVVPGKSGIISNEWFDRASRHQTYCVLDSGVKAVGVDPEAEVGRMSPRNYLVQTVCDFNSNNDPEARTVGIAIKDRGAILPAGHRPISAFWFDAQSGNWISSTYYFGEGELPGWVNEFNARKLPESYLGKRWERLLAESLYAMPDDAPGEGIIAGEERPLFPHVVHDLDGVKERKRFDAILPMPFGNDLTAAFAEAAIDGERLGQRGHTDVLTLSFSSPDYCGHTFGPDSREQQDMMVHLDRQLASFFRYLDKTVGFKNCLLVLSADHGVAPIPEQTQHGKRLFKKPFLDSLRTAVDKKYPNVILEFYNDEVYLDTALIMQRGYIRAEVEHFVGRVAQRIPGIAKYYTRTQLRSGKLDRVGIMVANSFNAARSGDVHIVVRENWFFAYGATGTTHGTPYDYDRHVPIVFCGPGVKPGSYTKPTSTVDIAPTLVRLLGIKSDVKFSGRILHEILR